MMGGPRASMGQLVSANSIPATIEGAKIMDLAMLSKDAHSGFDQRLIRSTPS
jgi:hypothetical protein